MSFLIINKKTYLQISVLLYILSSQFLNVAEIRSISANLGLFQVGNILLQSFETDCTQVGALTPAIKAEILLQIDAAYCIK